MKILLMLIASAVLWLFEDKPDLYLGHAEIMSKKNDICIVRPIYAGNLKEADSLFMCLVKSIMGDTAKLVKNNYAVWKVQQKAIVEKKDTAIHLKPF